MVPITSRDTYVWATYVNVKHNAVGRISLGLAVHRKILHAKKRCVRIKRNKANSHVQLSGI